MATDQSPGGSRRGDCGRATKAAAARNDEVKQLPAERPGRHARGPKGTSNFTLFGNCVDP